MSANEFTKNEIKDAVKSRYAKAIQGASSCCGPSPAQNVNEETGKGRNILTSLAAAIWFLSAAIMVMRIAEVFYVPILPLYVKALDAAAPLLLIGLVTGIHRLSLAIT